MAELKLRLNLDAEEVELVVDGQVALTSGKDVFNSWVSAVNEKNKPVEPLVVEAPVPAEPVVPETPVVEPPAEPLDTPTVEVDTATGE